MSEDYAAIAAEALDAIADVGFAVTVTRKTSQPSSPNSGAPTMTTDYEITVVQTKTSRAFIIGGQEIIASKTLLVPATGFVPQQGDKVTLGAGNPMRVVRVQATAPGGVDVLYKVDLAS